MLFCGLPIFFKVNILERILLGIQSICQNSFDPIRPDILSGLIWVQTACKGYQQTALVGKVLTDGRKLAGAAEILITEIHLG